MRLSLIPPPRLTPSQKPLYEDMRKVINSHLGVFRSMRDDGALMGPWNPWLHEPVFGGPIWEFAKVMTTKATLPEAARQVAILVVGAHYKAAYEMYAHTAVAHDQGMPMSKVATIVAGLRPTDLTDEEGCAYDVASTLVRGGILPDICYTRAVTLFGDHAANELIFLVGLYCLVSVTLNGFNVAVPTE